MKKKGIFANTSTFLALLVILIHYLTFIGPAFLGYLIYKIFYLLPLVNSSIPYVSIIFTTIWIVIFGIGLFFFSLLSNFMVTHFLLWIVRRVAIPRPGSFNVSFKDKDFKAWQIRIAIKDYSMWLFYHLFKIEFFRKFLLRSFGVKIGKNVRLPKYVDLEFIEIGDNVFCARNSLIYSHLIDNKKFTISPTKIGNNVIIYNISGAVGSVLEDNCKYLAKGTGAMKGNVFEEYGCYTGLPPQYMGDSRNWSKEQVEALKKEIIDNEYNYDKKKLKDIKINKIKLYFLKFVVVATGVYLASLMIIFYFFILFPFISFMLGIFGEIILVTFFPIIMLIIIGLFLIGVSISTKLINSYYYWKYDIKEGVYDIHVDGKVNPILKAWKTALILKKMAIRFIHTTPLTYMNTFVLIYWGNKIGKDVSLMYNYFDPEFLEIDDYALIGVMSTIHTHNLTKDGKILIAKVKIGKRAIIGGVAHIGAGCEIGDKTFLAVAAYIDDLRKLDSNSFYMGNPGIKIPWSIVKAMIDEKGRTRE